MQPTSRQTKNHGFTLVEMLVVAPLIVLVVATIVGFMVSLVGNAMIASSRSQIQYDAQDALNQIEQDAFLSSSFISSLTPASPQGKNDDTTAFTATNQDIILNAPATTTNPSDPTRSLIYYANSPNTCASGNYQINDLFYTKVVYFIRNNTLIRRSIVPTWNTNTTVDSNTVCNSVWQRNSCSTISGTCVTKDAILLSNISSLSMSVSYYRKSDPATLITGDLSTADSLKVSLTIGTKAAGENTTFTTELAASRSDK